MVCMTLVIIMVLRDMSEDSYVRIGEWVTCRISYLMAICIPLVHVFSMPTFKGGRKRYRRPVNPSWCEGGGLHLDNLAHVAFRYWNDGI